VKLEAVAMACPVEWIQAAADEGEGPKLRRFSALAYTGGPMLVSGFYRPVVVDLAGLSVPTQNRPIFHSHDEGKIVGHSDKIEVSAQRIKISGVVSGVGEAAQEIQALAANGFPWQASIGATVQRTEFVDAGQTVKVNGKNHQGPLVIARTSTLKEVSFVALGADDNTTAAIAAGRSQEDGRMTEFEKWLQAKSIDGASLTAETKTALEAAFNAEVKAKADADKIDADRKAKEAEGQNVDIVAKQNELAAANLERIARVQELCTNHPKIAAQAVKENWNETKTELEVLRASRANVPAIHSHGGPSQDATVIEAGMRMSLGRKNLDKEYKPEVLEAAHRDYKRVGLHQVMLMAAEANGYQGRTYGSVNAGNLREVLQYACGMIRASGFSTLSLPNILSNVANKELLAGYMEEDQTWREIASVKSVSDFKAVTAHRMLDNMEYEALGDGANIAHGTMSEETYTRQAGTYAKMFTLTRQTMINDDMGALDDLRERLGRGAAKKFNNVFWAEFINNSSHYTTALTNYIEGSTTNLGADGVGLGLGVKQFRKMTSPTADGTKRVGHGMQPTKMLVPPEIEGIAEALYKNQNLGAVATSSANIYANKYRPIVQNRLSDSSFSGYSTTAWYLLSESLSPMVVSFLNGQESPTVESADADFSTLGMQFRGYHDFGCDLVEYLGSLKSKGAV
jgi:hypothetical protein